MEALGAYEEVLERTSGLLIDYVDYQGDDMTHFDVLKDAKSQRPTPLQKKRNGSIDSNMLITEVSLIRKYAKHSHDP